MKRKIIGIGFGVAAGILDVLPMLAQGLTWDANISAFSMWVVTGFVIASIDLKLHSVIKGILVAFMILLPSAILIAWKEPVVLLPITVMTLVLGGGLGFCVDRFGGKSQVAGNEAIHEKKL